MIMSGLTNNTSDDSMAAAVEYAEKIRLAGRNIDDHAKRQLVWYYSICLHSRDLLTTISAILPPSEQILLLDWLKQANLSPGNRRVVAYFIAYFAELGGKKEEALGLFTDLARAQPNAQDEIARLSQAAASRLTKR
jgi:hypothetical protein